MSDRENTAHVHCDRGQMAISGPFDEGFIASLKEGTESRRWSPQQKAWTVTFDEREKALEIARHFYDVVEDNSPSSDPVQQPELSEVPLLIEAGDHVDIWADGACLVNPGPGAYAAVISHEGVKTEVAGGFKVTTNNRMEIMGAIAALETIPDQCEVTIYSDSRYVVDSMARGRVSKWKANKWKKKLNSDLWQRLLDLCADRQVELKWVKGHSNQPENERCNELAEEFARTSGLLVDEGYEARINKGT